MTAPTDDDGLDEDACRRTARVPTAVDPFGNPIAWIETDPEVAGQLPSLKSRRCQSSGPPPGAGRRTRS